jgi:adenosylcobinamide-GDP ribazoletransferase
MREAGHFLHAVRFLTILPVSEAEGLAPDWLVRCAKYFPLVGILIGVASAAVLIAASRVWPDPLPALLAVVAGIPITAALHEDGLADFADALGGRTREARLAIMKDSRLGTYGALALGLTLALKVAALASMPLPIAVAALIAQHGLGRLGPVAVMAILPYAGNPEATKIAYSGEQFRAAELAMAVAFGLLAVVPALVLAPSAAFVGMILALAVTIGLVRLARRLLGGYTGDVLGATEQLSGASLLLGCAAVMP